MTGIPEINEDIPLGMVTTPLLENMCHGFEPDNIHAQARNAWEPCIQCGERPTHWPGHVSRQQLAEYAQARTRELAPEADQLLKAMEVKGISDEQYETLFSRYYMNLGEQHALRAVTEWARENVIITGE